MVGGGASLQKQFLSVAVVATTITQVMTSQSGTLTIVLKLECYQQDAPQGLV